MINSRWPLYSTTDCSTVGRIKSQLLKCPVRDFPVGVTVGVIKKKPLPPYESMPLYTQENQTLQFNSGRGAFFLDRPLAKHTRTCMLVEIDNSNGAYGRNKILLIVNYHLKQYVVSK